MKEEKKEKLICPDGQKKEEKKKLVNLNDSVSLDEYDHEDGPEGDHNVDH